MPGVQQSEVTLASQPTSNPQLQESILGLEVGEDECWDESSAHRLEHAFHVCVRQDDGRLALERLVVAPLKAFAVL